MSDPRATPANGRVRLRGWPGEGREVDGTPACAVANPFLYNAPGGRRERQLLWGDAVRVIETRDGWAFLRAEKDGYCGYVRAHALGPPVEPTHRVVVRSTWAYPAPDMKAPPRFDLHMTSPVRVEAEQGLWARIAAPGGTAWVPSRHLAHVRTPRPSITEAAGAFLGTPYVWGGNTGFGLDCSGLVQASLRAAGHDCPGDSDQQMATGAEIGEEAPLAEGDLIFWREHVAILADAEGRRFIHANAHAMAVTWEDFDQAVARIADQGDGPVLVRRRLPPPA